MKSDASRIHDLSTIYDAIQNPSISVSHREYLEQVMDRILRESKSTRELRDRLIQATRNGDLRSMKYYQNELLRERYGQIGNSNDYLPIKI